MSDETTIGDVAAGRAAGSEADGAVGRADALEQLDRLVRAGIVAPQSRAHALLGYLLDHHLDTAPGTPVKAYAIAVDVLGRGEGFDPAVDSIVRVEVGRLRKLLSLYETGPGRADPVVFRIPKGQYALEVERRQPGVVADREGAPHRLSLWRPALLALALVLGVAVWAVWHGQPGQGDGFPRLRVEPILAPPDAAGAAYLAHGITAFLAGELSHFRSLRVVMPDPPPSLRAGRADYVLSGTLMPGDAPDGQRLTLILRRAADGKVLWSETSAVADGSAAAAEPVIAHLSGIVRSLGGPLGVLGAEGRAQLDSRRAAWAGESGRDFDCYLRWQSHDLTKDPATAPAARACLKDRMEKASPVGAVWAAAAFQLYVDWAAQPAPSPEGADAALRAGYRAVLLDPLGADGHEALGSILTALGRLDEAAAALDEAARLNPSNPEIEIKRGWLDCLAGRWQEGMARIEAVLSDFSAVPGWYRLPLALDALRAGDAARLAEEAARISASGDPRGEVLALAAARLETDAAAQQQAEARMASRGVTAQADVAAIAAVFPDAGLMAKLQALVAP